MSDPLATEDASASDGAGAALLTTRETARILGVGERSFRRIRGALTPIETAAGTMYDRAQVLRFAAERPARPRRSAAPAQAKAQALAASLGSSTAPAPEHTDPEIALIATAPNGEALARVAHQWTPARRARFARIVRNRDATFAEMG